MNDLISIVIPVYNVEKYLDKCVNSLISQTYKNIEIILVDDGSKDSSLSICQEWTKKDKRIQVFHQDNSGMSVARNLGVSKSTGSLIFFVDSDDCISEKTLEIMYGSYVENHADSVCCGYVVYAEEEPQFTYECEPVIVDGSHACELLLTKFGVG